MSELFREIEEDLRRDKMQRLWSRFGKTMVWASVAIVCGTAAGVLWKDHKQSEAARQTSQLMKGIDQYNAGDFKGAASAFDTLTADTSSPYYSLAMLRKAQAQAASNDKEGAARTYQILAQHTPSEGDEAFIDLARLETAGAGASTIEPKKNSPFYHTLMEWKAWQLLKQERKDEAVKIFTELTTDVKTPSSMRERLTLALDQIAPKKTKGEAHD